MSLKENSLCTISLGVAAVAAATGAGVGYGLTHGGVVAGALLGALGGHIGMIIGGVIGCLVGFAFGGYLAVKSSKFLFEKYWPKENEEELGKQQTAAAMKQFGIDEKRLNDDTHSSAAILSRKFRAIALTLHPDRPEGSREAFQELAVNYGLLTALLDNYDEQNKEKDAVKLVLSITAPAEQ